MIRWITIFINGLDLLSTTGSSVFLPPFLPPLPAEPRPAEPLPPFLSPFESFPVVFPSLLAAPPAAVAFPGTTPIVAASASATACSLVN